MFKKYLKDLKREFGGYNGKRLTKDLMAGITVAAVALPLALAFGISSGADAAAGLVTAIISGIIISAFSGASFQISGPTGAMAAILVTLVAKYGIQGMFITTFIAGAILLICGVLKLGRLVEYIPVPVITGFTSGIALVIALGQIDNLFGTTSKGDNLIEKCASYFKNGFDVNITVMLIGFGAVILMIIWPKKWNEKFPSSLLAIIIATLVTFLLKIDVPTVGAIPRKLILDNRINFTGINLDKLITFLSPAFAIAILGMIESLLCGSSASKMKKEPFNSDRELVSQGIGNILIPFFGGVPATAAIARTSVAIKSGGQTRLTGIFHAVFLIICMFVLSPVIAFLPLSALAGVLIMTAWRMNDWKDIKYYFSKKLKGPILKYLVTMIATVVFDLTIAIVCGVIFSFIVFIYNISKISIATSEVEPKRLNDNTDNDLSEYKDTIVVYITGPMFFANAHKMIRELKKIKGCNKIIFSMRGVPLIDATTIMGLYDFYKEKTNKNCRVIFCGVQNDVIEKLKHYEIYDKIGEENFYWSVDKVLLENND